MIQAHQSSRSSRSQSRRQSAVFQSPYARLREIQLDKMADGGCTTEYFMYIFIVLALLDLIVALFCIGYGLYGRNHIGWVCKEGKGSAE